MSSLSKLGRVIICLKATFPVCWAANPTKKQSLYVQYIDRFLPVSRFIPNHNQEPPPPQAGEGIFSKTWGNLYGFGSELVLNDDTPWHRPHAVSH